MIKLYLAKCNKKNEHAVGVRLAEYALYDAFTQSSELVYRDNGKPYYKNADAYVRISHTDGLCLAAISDTEIGADIEKRGGDPERLIKLAKRYFTETEAAYVAADPMPRFFEIWCSKESYIKYTGEGFSRPLSSFSLSALPLCFSLSVVGDCTLAVCSDQPCDMQYAFVELDE